MMTHKEHPDSQRLMAFLHGELAEAEASLVQDHCSSCAECRQVLDGFGAVQNLLQADIADQKPQPVWPVVAREMSQNRGRVFSPSFVFGTVAACAAGIAMGLLMGSPSNTMVTEQGNEAWASANYLWSGTDSPSLFQVFSEENSQERSGES